jgi:voltage-gated sodium channel
MQAIKRLIESSRFQNIIMALIALNAIVLGLETLPAIAARYSHVLHMIDNALLAVFVVELSLRLLVYRLSFFKDPWNVFDFLVVGISLIPNSGALSVLRALRILRALRLIAMVPSMKRVVTALLSALPGMGSIITLLLLIQYVFAVMATKLFAADSPEFFGDLLRSLFTLFQIMTTEGWADIARAQMAIQPWAWIFFVIYILASTFTVLNLFIGVVVSAMQEQVVADLGEAEKVEAEREEAHFKTLLEEVKALRGEIKELRAAQRSS